jgi:hypothetical protein
VKAVVASLVLVAGCAKPEPAATTPPPKDPRLVELALLMKNEINPAFSKLSFLVLHADEMGEDKVALTTELKTHATALRTSLGRLRTWSHPPTTSQEGKEVFFTFAVSVDKFTADLETSIASNDEKRSIETLEQIAENCNNCHHFFRLKLEDSVVGKRVGARKVGDPLFGSPMAP